jgi:hypothetical protein
MSEPGHFADVMKLAFDVGFLDETVIEQADRETFHRCREA